MNERLDVEQPRDMLARAEQMADRVQRGDAVLFNGRQLLRILRAYDPQGWDGVTCRDAALRVRAAQLVRLAEAGRLADQDSRTLGAFALAVLREVATG
jgi:hypothetical protein